MARAYYKLDRTRRKKCVTPKLRDRGRQRDGRHVAALKQIVVADTQPVCRYALTRLFNGEPDLTTMAEAANAQALMIALASKRPDLLVMGLDFPDAHGIEVIKTIRSRHPGLPVLVLSALEERIYAERALRAGAQGFVDKDEPLSELLNGVRCVLRGEIYLSRKMSILLLHRTFRAADHGGDSSVSALTDRELYVFQLLGVGLSSRKVATQLGLSLKTIESHRENIKHKLRLQDGSELVRRAVQFVDGLSRSD